jgi:hypothetical protein
MSESGLAIQTMDQAQALAKTLAPSALLPDSLRGKPGDVLIVLLTGAELGLGPMQSLRSLAVVKGKAVMSADLMLALVKKSPACEYLVMTDYGPERVTFKTKRKGDPSETVVAFSKADAERAGLWGVNTWKAYPQSMLKARAASAICRSVYPDVCLGIYDETEAVADFKVPVDSMPAIVQVVPTVTVEPIPEEPQPPEAAYDAHTGEVIGQPQEDGDDVLFAMHEKKVREAATRADKMKEITKAPAPMRQRLGQLLKEVR